MSKNLKLNKKILGYILILIGIAIPLFGFGSISYNNLMQNISYESFKNVNESKDLTNENKKIESYNDDIKMGELDYIDPFNNLNYTTENIYYNTDEVFGYLLIPSLDIKQEIRLGASYKNLAKGVAQIDGTSIPVGGIGTRSVLAGHRGWYRDVMFLYLDELQAGDRVLIDRGSEVLTYEVKNKEVIQAWEWEKLAADPMKDELTLLTCHPFAPPRPKRLLINCERVIEEKADPKVEVQEEHKLPASFYIFNIVTVVLSLAFIFTFTKLIKYIRKN